MQLLTFKRICRCLSKYLNFYSKKKVCRDEIQIHEILVRTILSNHLKKGKIKETELYVDTRGDVSLNRYEYTNENICKEHGLKIEKSTESRNKYIGFALFKFSDFKSNVEIYKHARPDFEANIFPTPLDENNLLRNINEIVYTTDSGNPAHADLKYINPDQKPNEDSPNTSLRVFSRELFKSSTIIFDNIESQTWDLNTFEYYYCSVDKQFNIT